MEVASIYDCQAMNYSYHRSKPNYAVNKSTTEYIVT